MLPCTRTLTCEWGEGKGPGGQWPPDIRGHHWCLEPVCLMGIPSVPLEQPPVGQQDLYCVFFGLDLGPAPRMVWGHCLPLSLVLSPPLSPQNHSHPWASGARGSGDEAEAAHRGVRGVRRGRQVSGAQGRPQGWQCPHMGEMPRAWQGGTCHIPYPLPCRLFEMGFAEQLQEIIARLPDCHQTVLFSATLPKLLVEFARAGEEWGAGGTGDRDTAQSRSQAEPCTGKTELD